MHAESNKKEYARLELISVSIEPTTLAILKPRCHLTNWPKITYVIYCIKINANDPTTSPALSQPIFFSSYILLRYTTYPPLSHKALVPMAPAKSTKTSGPLKQAKLSFASKRTTSAPGKAGKVTRKQPARTPSNSSSTEPIVLSDSDRDGSLDDEGVAPVPKKRRLNANAQGKKQPGARSKEEETVAAEPEPELEREPLKLSDERWRKLYGAARAKSDHLEPGEFRSLLRGEHAEPVSLTVGPYSSAWKRAVYGPPYPPSFRPVSHAHPICVESRCSEVCCLVPTSMDLVSGSPAWTGGSELMHSA